ncbi:hypothetical protein A9Q84_19295 [Halobacteriovorax marinus]|uniref:Prepilin-type N-terminal cleavage/methylation domain-containing protein n=1 Tax=Halobacteriovorax marinus TaxID=97084 RepID=A0A1Y5F2E6_9BACT|nr:hypothetical protein A9Q84_19295 [Halobacteriovorax marinus]
MKKKKNLLNSSGFSLAEVMVAAAMVGVVSLGVMQLMTNMTKGQKEFEQNAEIRGIMNRISLGLQDSNTCNYSLVALKYANGNPNLYDIAEIAAANINVVAPAVVVQRIAKPGVDYFAGGAAGPLAAINVDTADDRMVASQCDETYGGGTTEADLRAFGCLYGQGKGKLMINKMWLGQNAGGTTELYVRFIAGGLIKVYRDAPATDLTAFYTLLINGTPAQQEQAGKMSGSFGSPIITKSTPIVLSDVQNATDQASIINLGSIADITDPVAGLAIGEITNCFTNLTDTIQAACENFGGTYMLTDGSCRALKIRSDNASNAGENGYANYLAQVPTSAVSPGGNESTALSTEGHLYVGPLNALPGTEATGSNAWISGRVVVANPNTAINFANTNQGDILGEGALRLGTKATASVRSNNDDGSLFASSGLQLGAQGTVPDPASGDIWTSGNLHSDLGIALGTDVNQTPTAGDILTSGGLSLGANGNNDPDVGDIQASGGISLGGKNANNPAAGDIITSGGLTLGSSTLIAPSAGSVFGNGSLHLGTHANTGSAGAGHIRISGALNVGNTQVNTTAGQAHIKDKAYVYGMAVTEGNLNALTTVEWVRNRIASTLAPTGSDAAAIAGDILSTAIKGASSGVIAIQRDTCTNTYFKNYAGTRVRGTWISNTCRIGGDMQMAKDCSIGYQCSQVYSNTFMYAKTYVRALSYLRSGTYLTVGTTATIGGNTSVGGSLTSTGRLYVTNYILATSYIRSNSYVQGSKFCIGSSASSSCITKVKSNNCSGTQKVVGWKNGNVTCINEARWY